MRRIAALAGLATVAAAAPAASAAAPGTIDRSFGEDGVVSTTVGAVSQHDGTIPTALAARPDGSLYAGGTTPDDAGRSAFVIVRYTPKGALDSGFGSRGIVRLQLGDAATGGSSLSGLAVTPDGGVVAVGTAWQPGGVELAAVRLFSSGAIYWSRSHQLGTPPAQGGLPASGARTVMPASDGRLLIGGSATTPSSAVPEMALAMLAPQSGVLDPAFGLGGVVIDPTPRQSALVSPAFADALAVRPDGSLLAGGGAGYVSSHSEMHVPILRAYTTSGERVSAFTPPANALSRVTALALGPSGAVIAAGESHLMEEPGGPAIARYSAAGPLDSAFAAPFGFRRLPGAPAGSWTSPAVGIASQTDGRIVSAHGAAGGRLARVLPDGRTDESFGVGGAATLPFLPSAIAMQPDGGFAVLGRPPGDERRGEAVFQLTRVAGGTAPGRTRLARTARFRGSAALLRVACGGPLGSGMCTGRLRLEQATRPRRGSRARYGTLRFKIRQGEEAVVSVRLAARARGILARRGRLVVRAVVSSGSGGSRASLVRVRR